MHPSLIDANERNFLDKLDHYIQIKSKRGVGDFEFGMDENISLGIDSSSYDYDLSDAFKHPIQIEVFISMFVWSVSLLTVTGNILVFASFVRDPKLRAKISNLFILNLAVADFIVGTNSLTVNNLWRYYGNWPFGESLCKFWMIFDYTSTAQSAFAIVLISLDRYLMVTMELGYRTFMNRWKAGFSIVFTWIISLMFFAVPFIGFDKRGPGSWVNYSITCDVAVLYVLPYNIVTIIYAFGIPGFLLIFFNLKIFLDIRKRSGGLIRSRQIGPLDLGSAVINTVADQLQDRLQPSQSIEHVSELKGTDKRDEAVSAMNDRTCDHVIRANTEHECRDAVNYKPRNDVTPAGHHGNRHAMDSSNREAVAPAGHYNNRDARAQQEVAIQIASRENRFALKRDKKAAMTLFMLVVVYLICWLPYYVTQMLYVYYEKDYYISWTVWNAVYYLVWLNSALNPCLYAIRNPKIRKHFLDLLCIWKRSCKP